MTGVEIDDPGGGWRWLTVPGQVIVLSTCTLVASVPLITALPAIIGQQRMIIRWREEGDISLFRRYWCEFRRELPGSVLPGLAAAVVAVVAAYSATAWASAQGPTRAVGLAVVLPLCAFLTAVFAAYTEVSARMPTTGVRERSRYVLPVLASSPWRAAGIVIGLVAWAIFALRYPLLVLPLICGIPGILVHWAFAEPTLTLTPPT